MIAAVCLIVEDKNKDVMSLGLYNQINTSVQIEELNTLFPKGMRIGIKQPYLKVSYRGIVALRNDNI